MVPHKGALAALAPFLGVTFGGAGRSSAAAARLPAAFSLPLSFPPLSALARFGGARSLFLWEHQMDGKRKVQFISDTPIQFKTKRVAKKQNEERRSGSRPLAKKTLENPQANLRRVKRYPVRVFRGSTHHSRVGTSNERGKT